MAQDAIINRWNVNGDIYEIQDAGRGHPLGVATLDENGQVPLGQLPENIDVTDAVTDGDMHPVTSNAVYDALKNKDDVPLGSIMSYYGTSDPTDGKWFICDGRDTTGTAIELETHYPSLYIFLGGTNVLPDLREVTLVGAGQNTTDSIANHDTYTVGQFKDDQIQNITGSVKVRRSVSSGTVSAIFDAKDIVSITGNTTSNVYLGQAASSGYSDQLNIDASRVARAGTTTHGKQKGVNYIIKATSSSDTAPIPGTDIQTIESYVDTGLTAVTNAFNTKIAQAESYSTEEVWTGGYWNDGKKIYRKAINTTNLANNTVLIQNVDTVVNSGGTAGTSSQMQPYPFPMSGYTKHWDVTSTGDLKYRCDSTTPIVKIWFEYTKTTE